MEKIFISYSREDRAAAREIFETLHNRPEIDPWLDEKRLNLVPYDADIKKRIEASSYVLVVISAASLSSTGYVATEWAYAVEKQKPRLPFLLDRSVETNPQAPAILEGVKEIN